MQVVFVVFHRCKIDRYKDNNSFKTVKKNDMKITFGSSLQLGQKIKSGFKLPVIVGIICPKSFHINPHNLRI